MELKEIEYSEFCNKKFDFIVGEYATYNQYYSILIKMGDIKITFGLQSIYIGIFPQVKIFKEKILIGAGEIFYVYDFAGNLIKEYFIGSAFYECITYKEYILIIGEVDVILLNNLFVMVWKRQFNEIIDLKKFNNEIIELIDYNQKIIKLDFFTGKNIR